MPTSPHSASIFAVPPVDGREGGVLGQPLQLHLTGLAVAVFGNDALRQIVIFAVLVVIILPIEEHDDIRVLLDGAGFPQV